MPDFSRNFFEIFNLPPGFDVDQALLTARYRELQRTVHPDKYAHASAQDRRLAVAAAADINEAFRTLKEPVARALYLLRLKGVAVDGETARQVSPDFLMEQMELREALSTVRSARVPSAELQKVFAAINRLESGTLDALRTAFARNDMGALQQANEEVQKLRFVIKLHEEAQDVDDQINTQAHNPEL